MGTDNIFQYGEYGDYEVQEQDMEMTDSESISSVQLQNYDLNEYVLIIKRN